MILFINACVRHDSRTKRIADKYLKNKEYKELKLIDIDFPKVDEEYINKRDDLRYKGLLKDPMFNLANEFRDATEIVIAAPYWDFSFPATLKQYFELINISGITFTYNSDGSFRGLCKATSLTYITTAGGDYCPLDYGFGYVKSLAESFYGINDIRLIKAKGLDIDGRDSDKIIDEVIKEEKL